MMLWSLLDAIARTIVLVGIVAGVAVIITGVRLEVRDARRDPIQSVDRVD